VDVDRDRKRQKLNTAWCGEGGFIPAAAPSANGAEQSTNLHEETGSGGGSCSQMREPKGVFILRGRIWKRVAAVCIEAGRDKPVCMGRAKRWKRRRDEM